MRRNFMWPLVVCGVAVLLLLQATDTLSPALSDLLKRSWGALVVLFGLNMLLAGRWRYGQWLALVLTLAVLGGIVFAAYQQQAGMVRQDKTSRLEPLILGENIQGLILEVDILDARVLLQSSPEGERHLSARYVGSEESEITWSAQEDSTQGLLTVTIRETRPNALPQLERIGRGEFQIFLPPAVTVTELRFKHQRGGVTLDLRGLDVPRFNLSLAEGNMDVYLPLAGVVIGDVTLERGDLRLLVDPSIPLRVFNPPPQTNLDPNVYQPLANGPIESRGGLTSFLFEIRLQIGKGSLTLTEP